MGWGAEAGPVHLRPAAHFRLAMNLPLPGSTAPLFSTTPVELTLAAANLVDEKVTGLRLTPALGVTIPTSVGPGIPYTQLSAALQLERRFGPVELAWRAETTKPLLPPQACGGRDPLCAAVRNPIDWTLENSLQGEGWFTPAVSVGARLGWLVAWNQLLPGGLGLSAQTVADTRQSTSGQVWVSWALLPFFGVSADFHSVQSLRRLDGALRVPFFAFDTSPPNSLTASVSVWFRSDALLARNWLER